MIYYILPGVGPYGGIKKAFHCVRLLSERGIDCAVATPGGERPDWFENDEVVVDRDSLPERCRLDDILLFSWPPDAELAAPLKAHRKIVHMQGANTAGDIELMTGSLKLEFISHGLHMTHQLLLHNIVAPYVPIGIPDVFRYKGEKKIPRSVAYMPRKGGQAMEKVASRLPGDVCLMAIENQSEQGVAEVMKSADIFLAISPNEAFGLPPLEAMCARCCVVGYPGDGGFEFMRHGETAHLVANNDEEQLSLSLLAVLDRNDYRDFLRRNGEERSRYYTLLREQEYLVRALSL
jgi:glycosyltransferase involved in cell wall biosynthesis